MKKIYVGCLSLIGLLAIVLAATTNAQTTSPALQEATKLNVQVAQLYQQNKFDEALPLAKRVVEIREKELSQNDQLLAVSHLNVAYIYRAKQKYYDAEQSFRRALKVEEKRLGKEHPDLYDLYVNLGWVCHAQAKSSEAEDLFKQATAIKEKQRGTEHKEVADALVNLAAYYQKIGKPSKSLPIYQRMLTIREKAFGEISKEYKDTLEQCACATEQNAKDIKTPEADKLWEHARYIAHQLDPSIEYAKDEVLKGTATKKVQPEYPRAALSERLAGRVLIKVLIDENGWVIEAKRLCGPDLLVPASEIAASKWEFSPTVQKGNPIKVQGVLTFNFKLQ